MNISFGNNSIGISPIIDTYSIKQDFLTNCKTNNALYPNTDELGNPTFNIILPFIIMIIGIIITVFTFIKSKPEVDKNNVEEKPKDKPYSVFLSLIIFILSVLFGLYGLYLYNYIYKPEYNKWSKNLSENCKDKLELLQNIERLNYEHERLLKAR
jgi:NADH:ubiquinone oxidoreductase subunit 5 (subunit L)/multisubunit Na+/H+ antiporter MnhA subunit